MRINGKEVAAEGKTIAQVLRERAVVNVNEKVNHSLMNF